VDDKDIENRVAKEVVGREGWGGKEDESRSERSQGVL
jgi:hypothetical protein